MPFEPVSPLGGFTGLPEEREPMRFTDVNPETRPYQQTPSVLDAAFRTENTVGSAVASEEVRFANATEGVFGGPVKIDPDYDPWADIADTQYEVHADKFARAGNRDHAMAIKADIDRETKDRDTISKSGLTGIGASMAAGVFDLPILFPAGSFATSVRGGVNLLRTGVNTAIGGTIASSASELVLQQSQQLRTPEESAVVIGGSTVLAGLLGAGFGKLFSRAEQAAIAGKIESDFRVPGVDESDPFVPGGVRVDAAPGASPKAVSVADIIRQTAEEILPPQVRVQVTDRIDIADGGMFGIRDVVTKELDDIFDEFAVKNIADLRRLKSEIPEDFKELRRLYDDADRIDNEDIDRHFGEDYEGPITEYPSSPKMKEINDRVEEILGKYGTEDIDYVDYLKSEIKAKLKKAEQFSERLSRQSDGGKFSLRSTREPVFDLDTPGGGRTAQIGDTEITYGVDRGGLVELSMIKTPEAKRGAGSARAALGQFLDEADTKGLRVGLTADPMDKSTTKAKLVKFYKSLGFVENKGKKRDFSTRLEFLREPQTPKLSLRAAPSEQDKLLTVGAWQNTASDFRLLLDDDIPRGRQHFEGENLAVFDRMAKNIGDVEAAAKAGDGAAARTSLASALSDAAELDRLAPGPRTNLYTQHVRAAGRRHQIQGRSKDDSTPRFSLAAKTDTPEFKGWFGESKVVDDGGSPLRVYHGTRSDIEEFNLDAVRETGEPDEAFFFSSDTGLASDYAAPPWISEGANVVPVYLKMERPLRIEQPTWGGRAENAELIAKAKAEGHDGIIFTFTDKHFGNDKLQEFVVFEPTQIKSSIGNRGTFDPKDPRISYGVRQGAEGVTAEGRFDPQQNLITISADALDPVKTLKHESIHALRSMGLFVDKEWKTLEAAARKQGWVESNNVRALYEDLYSGRTGDDQFSLRADHPSKARSETEIKAYHGTGVDFDKFDLSKADGRSGVIFFAKKPEFADVASPQGGRTIPVFIETKDFKAVDFKGKHWDSGPNGHITHEAKLAKDEGYKGLIARNVKDAGGVDHQILAFTEGTVRSAISDSPLFSLRGKGKASTGPLDPKLENLLIEEAIAEQFSLWRQGARTATGTVAKLFERIQQFLDRIGNALRGQGFQTADDVFAAVRGGDVAGRAAPVPGLPGGAAMASGMARSVGAAAREAEDNTLKSALGLEKARIDPLIYLQNSKSEKAKAYIQELAETPLAYKKNAAGMETAPRGSEMGEPGAVESRIKMWSAPLADGVQTLENAFMRYRKGRDKLPLDQIRMTIGDAMSKPEKLTWRQFKEEVARAARRGDQHAIPEVAQAAKFARDNVFNPLKERAIAKELLPEDISAETAESYLNRLYNKEKIIARRPEFKEIVNKWLDEAEANNTAISDRLQRTLKVFDDTQGFIAKTEAKIATLSKQERDVSIRREEASRFNQFAFKRAQKLSEPLDEARAKIVEISARIEEQTNRIDTVTETLRAEKIDHPHLKSLEKQMFNVAHTVSKIKKATDLFEVVDLAKEIDDSVTSFVDDMASASASFREGIKAYKAGPGRVVADMEKLRTNLRRKIAPYLKEIAANKKIIAEEEKAKLAGARGGAVFETAARKRVNTLADQQSGKSAELSNMELRLERHNTNLDALRTDIEEELGKYEGKSARDAVKALEARAKAEDLRLAKAQEEGTEAPVNRLRGADGPVLSSARKIAARIPKEAGETASLADEIIDRIIGTPDGRLPYDAHLTRTTDSQGVSSSARGPLAARTFMIPDELIEDFLENDFEMLMHAYVRTMAPDVELHARFDDVDMKQQIKEIQEDWARKAGSATSEKERRSLHAQRDGDIRRLAAIRDRLRGTYKLPDNPDGLLLRTGRVMRSVNYTAMLGGQVISAIPDMGSIVFSHGIMRTFGDGIIPLFRNFSGARMAMGEVKMAGTALDMVLDSRAMNIGEIMDDYGRHTKFERGVQSLARSFGPVSLMSPWNAAMKQTAGLITMSRIIRAADALKRDVIKKPDLERLAASGISRDNAIKIAEQFKKHGEKDGGVFLPKTENWDADARAAKEAFRVALVREVDKTIITPGQEKWLWMSSELGKTLGQFKSFSVSANQRLLIAGLQQRDMGTLSGAALMVALGGITHILKTKAGGHDPNIDWSDNEKTSQFMVNAVDRSGLLGWLMEANAVGEKLTGGAVGLSALTGRPISRYASRNLVGAMAGPSFGTLQSIGQVSSAGFSEWKETDTRAARRLIPYQNLFYLRSVFDKAEAGVNEFFGVPKTATRH